MKYLPLLFLGIIGIALGGGGGSVYAIGDHSSVGDSVVATVHRGAQVSTGDTVTATESVPEFGPVSAIILAIAVLCMVVFASKVNLLPRHKI